MCMFDDRQGIVTIPLLFVFVQGIIQKVIRTSRDDLRRKRIIMHAAQMSSLVRSLRMRPKFACARSDSCSGL